MIKIDLPNKNIELVGVNFQEKSEEYIKTILKERKKHWNNKLKQKKGILKVYEKLASSPMHGATIF